jgi:hypothetical protein
MHTFGKKLRILKTLKEEILRIKILRMTKPPNAVILSKAKNLLFFFLFKKTLKNEILHYVQDDKENRNPSFCSSEESPVFVNFSPDV